MSLFTDRPMLRKWREKDHDVLKKTWIDYMLTHKEIGSEDLRIVEN